MATAAESVARRRAAVARSKAAERRVNRRWTTTSAESVARVLGAEGFVVMAVSTLAVLLLSNVANSIGGDGWLLLAAGRHVLEDGLPARDTLTIWSQGEQWIDQQWVAQVAAYLLVSAAGIKAALIVNALVVAGAFALAAVAARRLGATSTSVAAVCLVCAFVAFPHSGFRAQTLAYPLFVTTIWLLAAEARDASRRIFAVFAVLVLWANVHGSVVLGAALVMLFGIIEIARSVRGERNRSRLTLIAILVAPWACVFTSPYALDLVGYYRSTLGNAAFTDVVGEWGPSSAPAQVPFFLLAFAAVWILARTRRLTAFDHIALLVLLAAGLIAIRNIVWFALAATTLLPVALQDIRRPASSPTRPKLNFALGAAAVTAFLAVLAVVVLGSERRVLASYPDSAAARISEVAASDRSIRIFANERFADWLVWRHPGLAGRIAFDVRFELLSGEELRSIARWRARSGDWKRAAAGYRLLVLDRVSEQDVERELRAEPGVREIYADDSISVLYRTRDG